MENEMSGPLKLGNLAENMAEAEQEASDSREVFDDPTPPDMILSLDIETLSLGPRPVITQIAMLGYDLQEDELMEIRHVQYYPIEPQQQIIPARTISASTIVWWMNQADEARERFKYSTEVEFEDLASRLRNLVSVFNQLTNYGKSNYELVAKGPQFDVVAVETLLTEVGLNVPWAYDRVIDLRTMLKRAGINAKNVAKPSGCIPHIAFWDARWQISQYLAASRGNANAV
jgi:hypothetical protein